MSHERGMMSHEGDLIHEKEYDVMGIWEAGFHTGF